VPYWYHRIELPTDEGGSIVTPGWAPLAPDRYCIPQDLTGLRVLDIGAWDGYWTWEAFKRGAHEVVAIDDFSDRLGKLTESERQKWETFDLCREALGFVEEKGPSPRIHGWLNSKNQVVKRTELSIYDFCAISEAQTDYFDIVFFFGTIYHLKHPLMALERISEICNGAIYVETASLDDFSPYRGGLGHGFNRNECVMEFYPGKEYGNNDSNWWVPTLQCLGHMLASVGFKDVYAWPLTETPKDLVECRGFVSATKNPEVIPANRPPDIGTEPPPEPMKIAAVMSVPRLGFTDNMNCTFGALSGLGIPLINIQGAFWGQCLERGIQKLIDEGADLVLTIDYDTVYTRKDVEDLIRLMYEHPEADAVVPMQVGRSQDMILTSMKTKTGQPRQNVPFTELIDADVMKIATGHFGLTLLRTSALMDLPHPWFHDKPNCDDQWGPGRIDADIWFWKIMERANKTVLLANRVVVGHLELLVTLPDKNMKPIRMLPSDFYDNGKPAECWQ
jgi:tRNA (mo5U34)-methyltransferase